MAYLQEVQEAGRVLVFVHGKLQKDEVCGVTRTSATSLRLEDSAVSPGVASISFDRVFDDETHGMLDVFNQGLENGVANLVLGKAMTLVTTASTDTSDTSMCEDRDGASGLLTLTLHHIFHEIDRRKRAGTLDDVQVLLFCGQVQDFKSMQDLIRGGNIPLYPTDDIASVMVEHSIRIDSVDDAIQQLSQCRHTATDQKHFVTSIHVESRHEGEQKPRQGRFLSLDLRTSAVVEPTNTTQERQGVSSDERLIDRTLSTYFGSFLGGESATYVVIPIHRVASSQQQAIQSLLYAYRVSEWKNHQRVCYIPKLTTPADHYSDKPIVKDLHSIFQSMHSWQPYSKPTLPASPRSNAYSEVMTDSPENSHQKLTSTTLNSYSNPTSSSQVTEKKSYADRLHQFYQDVKASHISPIAHAPAPGQTHLTTELEEAHAIADDGLYFADISIETSSLPLPRKIELLISQLKHTQDTLSYERSVKDKCVERIARLSHSLSFQTSEHEQALERVQREKEALEEKVMEQEKSYETIGSQILDMQQQMLMMRGGSSNVVSNEHKEKEMLQTFSRRLEVAMDEAKRVVEMKDSHIVQLENQLAQSRTSVQNLQQQLGDLQDKDRMWKKEMADMKKEADSHRKRLETHKMTLMSKVQQLQAEVEEREEQIEKIKQQRRQETRKSVFDLKRKICERDLELSALEQEKAWLQVLLEAVQRAHSWQESARLKQTADGLTDQSTELYVVCNRIETNPPSVQECHANLHRTVDVQDNEVHRLRRLLHKKEHELKDLQSSYETCQEDAKETEETLQREIHELHKRFGRQSVEKEAKMVAEFERKTQRLMRKHSRELLKRDMGVSNQVEHNVMEDDENNFTQQSLDKLASCVQQDQWSSSRGTKLEKELTSLRRENEDLTLALARVNDEHTRTKKAEKEVRDRLEEFLGQVNSLKRENWSLRFALQVAEKRVK